MNSLFDSRFQTIVPNLWSLIIQIDEHKGRWVGGVALGPQILGRLKQSVLITSTGASTRIEGAKLSDDDIGKLLKGISIQTFKNRDKQEVQGYYQLLKEVFENWEAIPFGENSLKHLHQELLKFVSKDELHRGDYKHAENKVIMVNQAGESIGTLFDTTPAYLTPKAMQELVEWTIQALLEQTIHPLLVIGHFVVEFLQIHPFTDGNGRLSRILTNLLLLKSGYSFIPYVSHEKIIEDNKPDYYLALRETQKTLSTQHVDLYPWLDFFFKTLLMQAQQAVHLFTNESIESLLSNKQLAVWTYLLENQEAGPKEIADHTQVALPTVRQALHKLLGLKKVERLGEGAASRYRLL